MPIRSASRPIIRLCLAIALVGVSVRAAAETPATSAASCQQRYETMDDAVRKLSYWDFDQTDAGWRQLQGCDAEQAQLLQRFLKRQASEMRGIRWHLAQVLAYAGRETEAAEEALQSVNPDEASQHADFKWNAYVLATVAFLKHDRAAFDVQNEILQAAVGEHPGNQVNARVTAAMARCFGKSYREAYRRGPCSAPD